MSNRRTPAPHSLSAYEKALKQRLRRSEKPWLRWYSTTRWRRYRADFLAYETACVHCGEAATIVDHKIPHRGDKRLFWDPTNHQAMCKACHDGKTSRRDGGFGRRRSEEDFYSGACGEDGFPVDPKHPFNR